MDLRFVNCSFSSGFTIGAVGGYEPSRLTFESCTFAEPCRAFISLIKNEPELWKYPANNLEWKIFGANNQGFILDITDTKNKGECMVAEAKNFHTNITVSGSAATLLFGMHPETTKSNARIKGRVKGSADVRDVQSGLLKYSEPKDVIQLWKRLGDCTAQPKELVIKTGDKSETFRFTKNYLHDKTKEKEILGEINRSLKEAVILKEGGIDIYDVIDMTDKKMFLVGGEEGIIKGEFVVAENYRAYRASASTPLNRVEGVAVSAASKNEIIKTWKGSFVVDLSDGEYGIGNDHRLEKGSQIKIGMVSRNIFYPYY